MASDLHHTAHGHGHAGDRIAVTTANDIGDDIKPSTTGRDDDKHEMGIQTTIVGSNEVSPSTTHENRSSSETEDSTSRAFEQLEKKPSLFSYLKTRDFYIILVLG